MNAKKWLLLTLAVLPLLAACVDQVPHPVTYERSTQQKMQAAHHWNLLAKDMADEIYQAFWSKIGTIHSVYVAKNTSSQFNAAFYELLCEGLVDNGLTIKLQKDNPLHIDYNVQMLFHPDRHDSMTHGWKQTSLPYREVIVTASIIDGGTCLEKINAIYYINDDDAQMYKALGMNTDEKNYNVSN